MANDIKGPAWIPTFLAALAETGKVGQSIEAAGISPNSAYFQRKTNARFAQAWQAALNSEAPTAAVAEIAPQAVPARNAGWRTSFLEALAETSNASVSAARVNVPLKTVYNARRSDPAFAAKWLAALHEGYDHLEMELLGYLRDPAPKRKMDVAGAIRLLAAHRDTVERRRAFEQEDDEQAVLDSIDRFIDQMRERRTANTAILSEETPGDGAE
jgi:hypothetical protein